LLQETVEKVMQALVAEALRSVDLFKSHAEQKIHEQAGGKE